MIGLVVAAAALWTVLSVAVGVIVGQCLKAADNRDPLADQPAECLSNTEWERRWGSNVARIEQARRL